MVAAVFSDNMVLQRDKNINIWGTGCNGDTVTVKMNGCAVNARVRDDKWIATLPGMKA